MNEKDQANIVKLFPDMEWSSNSDNMKQAAIEAGLRMWVRDLMVSREDRFKRLFDLKSIVYATVWEAFSICQSIQSALPELSDTCPRAFLNKVLDDLLQHQGLSSEGTITPEYKK